MPEGIEEVPGVQSLNGASSKPGGYTGGNGNEENISHDGSPVEGYEQDSPSMPSGAFDPASPSVPSEPSSDEDKDDIMGSDIPTGGIAPVDSMAPGEVVAPVNGEKQTHGADLGNSFCLGTCYGSKEEAKCQAPYVSDSFSFSFPLRDWG